MSSQQAKPGTALTLRQALDVAGTEFDRVVAPAVTHMLPVHIPVDKMKSTFITALNHDTDLIKADRRSLLNAVTKAAQDGLLPDKREGALVIFNTKQDNGTWIKAVQWMPMVQGLVKKAWEGAGILLEAEVVYDTDEFRIVKGTDPHIEHEPSPTQGNAIGAYAIARFRDGRWLAEWAPLAELMKIKSVSKSQGGPWKQWEGEMMRKSVIRRLSKRLPMNAQARAAFERDDDLVDFSKMPSIGRDPNLEALRSRTNLPASASDVPPPGDDVVDADWSEQTEPGEETDSPPPPDQDDSFPGDLPMSYETKSARTGISQTERSNICGALEASAAVSIEAMDGIWRGLGRSQQADGAVRELYHSLKSPRATQ